MPSLYLTQTDLNTALRGTTDVSIMTFLPDKNVTISGDSDAITVNSQALPYTSNLRSVIEFSSLPQINLATFENNSWILDGSFISPSEQYGGGGDSYSGYISNEISNDSGYFNTVPTITIKLAIEAEVNNLSFYFAGGIDTSYPRLVTVYTYDSNNSLIAEHSYDTLDVAGNTLPIMNVVVGDSNVKSLRIVFGNTLAPHRRIRVNKIMFGKAELVDTEYLQSWKIDDKASLVADSIPTKTLTYSIINYEGDYNLDNPGNKIPQSYNDVSVFFTFWMNDNGFMKYMPTKTFSLLDVSTTPEGIVTFSCGSILDTLTTTYDHYIYEGPATIRSIANKLLAFSNIRTDQIDTGEFGDYTINIPIPELPVRDIIQRLAFSCGATLTVDDDNKIIFSKKNIVPDTSTPAFMFNKPTPFNSAGVLLEEPNAEALEHTTNIAMYTYDTVSDEEATEIATVDVATDNPVKINFPAVEGGAQLDERFVEEQHAQITRVDEIYSQHAIIKLTIGAQATLPIKVKVLGRKANTTQTMPKEATMDTLLLDSGMTRSVPTNLIKGTNPDPTTFYYTDWYGAKFKYKLKTRKEYLIKAGDIIKFETPFSDGRAIRVGYVLRNSYSNDGDSGEMEVIRLDGN